MRDDINNKNVVSLTTGPFTNLSLVSPDIEVTIDRRNFNHFHSGVDVDEVTGEVVIYCNGFCVMVSKPYET